MPDTDKTTILYLDTAPAVGGSVISLLELLKGLDKERYQPLVVCFAEHPYVQRYEQAGAHVVAWNEYGSPDYRPSWAGAVRQTAPVQRWKEGQIGGRLYHSLGFGLWLARRGLPRATPVSYTHLTLPKIYPVSLSVGAVSLKTTHVTIAYSTASSPS